MSPVKVAAAYLRCPVDDSPLMEGQSGKLFCIHQSHDGRPSTHPEGRSPATKSRFTLDEVEAAMRQEKKA